MSEVQAIEAGKELLVRASFGTFLASQIKGIWITGRMMGSWVVVVDGGSEECAHFMCADEAEARMVRAELEDIWVKALEAQA
jgi:hypothetical protein